MKVRDKEQIEEIANIAINIYNFINDALEEGKFPDKPTFERIESGSKLIARWSKMRRGD